MPHRTPPKEQNMEEFLTRRFSAADVAWALQIAFPSEFFQGDEANRHPVVTDVKIVDAAGNRGEVEEVRLLGEGAKYVERRRIEITWARTDPKTGK